MCNTPRYITIYKLYGKQRKFARIAEFKTSYNLIRINYKAIYHLLIKFQSINIY